MPPEALPPSTPDPTADRWFRDEVQPHEEALRAYLQARFSNLGDIDDVVQETYSRLLRVHATGQVRSAKALLFTTARNAALDLVRRHRAGRTDALSDEQEARLVSTIPNAAEAASHRQELDLLAEAVGGLPDRCREVMLMRYRDGLACKEIASRLQLSPETIKVHLARGMRACAEFFAARGLIRQRRSNLAVS